MPEIPYGGVTGNHASDDELWAHGLSLDDADDVWEGPAKYFAQPARQREDELGNVRFQPERMKMIGPDRTGLVLTFVLELSDQDRMSHVVTGWISDDEERTRYHRPGGRMRRR